MPEIKVDGKTLFEYKKRVHDVLRVLLDLQSSSKAAVQIISSVTK